MQGDSQRRRIAASVVPIGTPVLVAWRAIAIAIEVEALEFGAVVRIDVAR
jgi:hypothetical protein